MNENGRARSCRSAAAVKTGAVIPLIAAVGLMVIVGLYLAAPASAYVNPTWFQELTPAQQEAAVNFLYEQSPQATVPYGGEAQEISESISHTYESETDTEPFFQELVGDTNVIDEGVGLDPPVGAALPEIYAAAGAFLIGWKIGEGIDSLFADIGLGGGSAPERENGSHYEWCVSQACGGALIWRPYGATVYAGATVQQDPGAFLYEGRLYRNGQNEGIWHGIDWDEAPCTFSGLTPPPGASMEVGVTSGANCYAGGKSYPDLVDYPYASAATVLGHEEFHPYDPLVDGTPGKVSEVPEDPGGTVVMERAEETLDENEFLQAYLGWRLFKESEPEDDPAKIGIPPKSRSSNDKCTPYGTPGTYDPGEAPKSYEGSDPEAVLVKTFVGIDNPFSGLSESVRLFWGNEDWGYRHIQMYHGWTEEDSTSTDEALREPDAIIPDKSSSTSKDYYKYYLGLDGKTKCKRFVVVQWSTVDHPDFPSDREPLSYGVITSMGIPQEEGDPEVGTGL